MRKVLGCVKRAQEEFEMIAEGDVVAVGLSGGKDSMTLLYALHLFQRFSPVSYTLKAITIDLGFPGFDLEAITRYCESLGVEHLIERTRISEIVFEERKEKNPCSLCARLRRGRINRICDERGITKLALAHHGDDAIETLFLNMLFESRIDTFRPVTIYERAEVTMIRPLFFATEEDVSNAIVKENIPVVKNPCPASGNTKRESIKIFLRDLNAFAPGGKNHAIEAIAKMEKNKKSSEKFSIIQK